uniref:Glucose/Sorbosone dehydrogenase domain-containing protein n=2 Tax=Kalanchoe fedtschenkoi TaxID=63787 RepID=A0A7N0VNA7_KALFE
MKGLVAFLSSICCLLLLSAPCFSHPLCTDSRAPFTANGSLPFCGYSGAVCCSPKDDLQLQKQFQAMNASDSGCASVLKSILCAKCDKYSAELFTVSSTRRPVPVLCNSTVSAEASQLSQAAVDYCSSVWDSCQNASLVNSIFAPSLQGQAGLPASSNSTKLTDFWQSKADFCNAFGGPSADESVCLAGEPVTLAKTETLEMANGMCLEKIGNGSFLNMVAHPDGSNRAFFSSQPGKIWLAKIPEMGSGGALELDESAPFLDLTDELHYDTKFGMMGLAFHPNFASNGRLFASFTCDKETSPRCSGRCACNTEAGCDPSKLGSDDGVKPCQYQTVIAEYTANGTAASPSTATSASPVEVRRIFTMGLPFTSNHGGQILFGPSDGYLYFMMGDGGSVSDPYKFAQNKKSLLGKIMRLDVDNMPSTEEANKLGLWGSYSIPRDNPYAEDEDLRPEIWAMGFRNPWRCSFDSARPSYFMCADVGQDLYEEVNMITKAGNYGWSMYEGPFAASEADAGNTTASSLNLIKYVMGYNHSEVNKNLGSAAITGGYFYRSTTDPCMTGRYLFGDLYANNFWAATEEPPNSGNFNATQIQFSCAKDSPLQCNQISGSSLPSLGYIFSYGQDNNKDLFILASSGVYRLASPDRCSYACSKLTAASPSPKTGGSDSPSYAIRSAESGKNLVLVLCSLMLVLLGYLC